MLYAYAKSARENRSRLRYSLEPGTNIDASLIRGRYEWRLASARERSKPPVEHEEARLLRARTLRLIRRMVRGEESNDDLYGVIDAIFAGLSQSYSKEEWSGFELLSVLRILSSLGYLGNVHVPPEVQALIAHSGYEAPALQTVHEKRLPLVAAVNEALKASHL